MATKTAEYGEVIWTPSEARVRNSQMQMFIDSVAKKFGFDSNWESAYEWSVTHLEEFWLELTEFTNVIWDTSNASKTVFPSNKLTGVSWFQDAQLNFAENLLQNPNDSLAISAHLEGTKPFSWTRRDLYNEVLKD